MYKSLITVNTFELFAQTGMQNAQTGMQNEQIILAFKRTIREEEELCSFEALLLLLLALSLRNE